MLKKSDDLFFILHGTAAMRTYIHFAAKEVKKVSSKQEIKDCTTRLLSPTI